MSILDMQKLREIAFDIRHSARSSLQHIWYIQSFLDDEADNLAYWHPLRSCISFENSCG